MKRKSILLVALFVLLFQQQAMAQAPSVLVQYSLNQVPFIKFDYQVAIPYKNVGNLKVYQIKTGADTLTVKNVTIKNLDAGSIIRNDLFGYKIVFCVTDSLGQKGYKGIVITYGGIEEIKDISKEFVPQVMYDSYGRLLDAEAARRTNGLICTWGYYKNHPDKFICIKTMQINR